MGSVPIGLAQNCVTRETTRVAKIAASFRCNLALLPRTEANRGQNEKEANQREKKGESGRDHCAQTPLVNIESSKSISDSPASMAGGCFLAHKFSQALGKSFDFFSLLQHRHGETFLVGLGYFSSQLGSQLIQLLCLGFDPRLP